MDHKVKDFQSKYFGTLQTRNYDVVGWKSMVGECTPNIDLHQKKIYFMYEILTTKNYTKT